MSNRHEEKRKHKRVARVLSVEYYPLKEMQKNMHAIPKVSLTEDMSAGGLTLYCDEGYRIGDMLHIKVTMSGSLDIFNGPAKIIRVVRKKGAAHFFVAVKFISVLTGKPAPKRPAKRHLSAPKKK